VLAQGGAPRDAALCVSVANLTALPPHGAAHSVVVAPGAPLFLADGGCPWPPQPLDHAAAPAALAAGRDAAWLEALESGFAFLMLNISFCCMFIIIVALLLVAIVKWQRKSRERARESARERPDRRHISTASRSVPSARALESTAQLAHGLLGATGSEL
jgi:hypothetical protein